MFLELANQVTKLRMYPYFDVAHAVISCLYMREDLGSGESEVEETSYNWPDAGSIPFSRRHPFACWVSCMCSIFSGQILAAFLLGEPILGAFKNSSDVLLASLVWYVEE